jgi:hypothetical protein
VVHLSDREIGGEIIDAYRWAIGTPSVRFTTYIRTARNSISLYFFRGDQAVASDVSQQVFLKLITRIGQFREDAGSSTWLCRLTVNACMDAGRRSKPNVVTSERLVTR